MLDIKHVRVGCHHISTRSHW